MNCKPGDIAMVIRAHHFPEMAGWVVRILGPMGNGIAGWLVEPNPPAGCYGVMDVNLLPLRNHTGRRLTDAEMDQLLREHYQAVKQLKRGK